MFNLKCDKRKCHFRHETDTTYSPPHERYMKLAPKPEDAGKQQVEEMK